MAYRLAADLVLVVHLGFILFVLGGGWLCLHRGYWAWLHLPAALWGVWVEWAGWICPLTPLENHFRQMAHGRGYHEGFIEHYLLPLIYPGPLSTTVRWGLAAGVVVVNLLVYRHVLGKRMKSSRPVDE